MLMTEEREKFVLDLAHEYIETECTVRELAERHGVSKTTVWKMLTYELPEVSKPLAMKAKKILKRHSKEAPRRGGIALRKKYKEES